MLMVGLEDLQGLLRPEWFYDPKRIPERNRKQLIGKWFFTYL